MDSERRKDRKKRRRSESGSDDDRSSSARSRTEPFNYDRHRTKLTKMFFRPMDLIKARRGGVLVLGLRLFKLKIMFP